MDRGLQPQSWAPLVLNFAAFLGELQLSIPPAASPLKLSLSPSRAVNLTVTVFSVKTASISLEVGEFIV